MSSRQYLLGGGLLLAAWLALSAGNRDDGGLAESVQRPRARAGVQSAASPETVHARSAANAQVIPEALIPRAKFIGSMRTDYDDVQLFGRQSWTAPPPPPPKALPPPVPAAPPLPYVFIGRKKSGADWEVYLASGERTLVVQANSIIDGLYRVEAISDQAITLLYLPLAQRQSLSIGGNL